MATCGPSRPPTGPPDLLAIRPVFLEHFGEIKMPPRAQGNLRFRREGAMSFSVGDDYTLVSPVTVFNFPEDHKTPPQIDVLGFTLIRLDPQYVRGTLLPTLTARHFHGDDGTADYRVAVTDRHEPANVIWESEPGAAGSDRAESRRGRHLHVAATRSGVHDCQERGGGPGRGTPPEPLTRPLPEERIVVSVLQDRRERGDRTADGPHRLRPVRRALAGGGHASRGLARSRGGGGAKAQPDAELEHPAAAHHGHRVDRGLGPPRADAGAAADGVRRRGLARAADAGLRDRNRRQQSGRRRGRRSARACGKYGETIQAESRRLAETVERVLQLAGIAAGSAAASRAPVPVADLVQSRWRRAGRRSTRGVTWRPTSRRPPAVPAMPPRCAPRCRT